MKSKKLFLFPQHTSTKAGLEARQRAYSLVHKVNYPWFMILAVALMVFSVTAYGQDATTKSAAGGDSAQASMQSEHGSLSEVGAKLSNPVSDVWALFTELDLYFSDGDLNEGSSEVGGRMIFQPVLPFPLYGRGEDAWKLITRPTIPVLFSQPVPQGFDEFTHLGGLGDTQLPMLVSPPSGNWLLGIGPTWLFPSATREEFGQEQWGVGPAAVIGYHTPKWLAGVFPQYTFGIGGWNGENTPDASYLSMLYFFVYNLPDAWQIGFNPTISYDDNAPSGNKWNVPVGLFVAKTTKIGNVPFKFQLGVEYSVVSEDDFGQRAQVKLNIIPVIPSLVKTPILSGE
jgi:hypothetical protein